MDGPLCALAGAPRQYQALLEVSQSVAAHRDLTALFRDLAERLPRVVTFHSLWLVLHDPARNRMRLHILEGLSREAEKESAWPLERPLEESPSALAWSKQEPLVVFNLAEDSRYAQAFQLLLDNGIRSCCILPLTTAHRRLGAVGFGYSQPYHYSEADVDFLGQVACQIAVAVDNVLAHAESAEFQAALAEERDRLRLLLDLNNTLAPNLDLLPHPGKLWQPPGRAATDADLAQRPDHHLDRGRGGAVRDALGERFVCQFRLQRRGGGRTVHDSILCVSAYGIGGRHAYRADIRVPAARFRYRPRRGFPVRIRAAGAGERHLLLTY